MPIIDLQRRLVPVGRIRMGEKKTGRNGKQYPAKLETWRLTSPDQTRLRAVAEIYGGTVRAWEGQHEVYTTARALDIVVIPGQAISQHLEHWGQQPDKGDDKPRPVMCLRRCDGRTELLSDSPCLCAAEAGDVPLCKPVTHLMVMLPSVPGIGTWRVTTRGKNAAAELVGTAEVLEQLTAAGQMVPARLRLDERTSVNPDTAITNHYVVPVIDIDVALNDVLAGRALGVGSTRAIAAPGELETAPVPFTPVPVEQLPPAPTASTRDQLAAGPPERARRANAAEPIRATGLKPGVGAGRTAPAPVGGAAGGSESPKTDGPVPSAAATVDVELVNEDGAQKVAMWCADAGIGDDLRSMFLYAFGGYTSSKEMPVEKLGELRATLDKVRSGALELVPGDADGTASPYLREPGADAPEAFRDASDTPPPQSIGWKAELGKVKGVGEVKLIRKARELCAERGYEPTLVTSLDTIPAVLNAVLRGWLDEQAAA